MPHPPFAVIEKPPPRVPPLPGPHADPDAAVLEGRFALARSEHVATASAVRAALEALGVPFDWFTGPALPEAGVFERIISVGGDGTFLLAARLAGTAPVLGVNSSPSTSVGRYCAARAETVGAFLGAILAGERPPTPLLRLRVAIDGQALPVDAMNDALFAHRCPVAATRYAVVAENGLDVQLSSGVWVATPTGSSGAMRSAGGELLSDTDDRLQWRVREPFIGGGLNPRAPRHLSGLTRIGLELLSRHAENAVFLDGHPTPYPAPLGARVRFFPSPEPLLAWLPDAEGATRTRPG